MSEEDETWMVGELYWVSFISKGDYFMLSLEFTFGTDKK